MRSTEMRSRPVLPGQCSAGRSRGCGASLASDCRPGEVSGNADPADRPTQMISTGTSPRWRRRARRFTRTLRRPLCRRGRLGARESFVLSGGGNRLTRNRAAAPSTSAASVAATLDKRRTAVLGALAHEPVRPDRRPAPDPGNGAEIHRRRDHARSRPNGTRSTFSRATRSARRPSSASARSMSARRAAGSALAGWRRR